MRLRRRKSVAGEHTVRFLDNGAIVIYGQLTEEDIKFVCDLVHKHDLLLVSDEIYSQLVYGFQHVSPHRGRKSLHDLRSRLPLPRWTMSVGWQLPANVTEFSCS